MNELFKTEGLSVSYDGKPALKDVSAVFEKNKITAVIGPSGCGKTTLLKCLNGMIREEKAEVTGDIFLNGEKIDALDRKALCRKVGMVFQTPSPFPFSILKNMTYALEYYGVRGKAELKRRAEEKLKLAGLYDEVKDDMSRNAMKLSGGQKQRLCIARALTVEPDVLLLDEPCSALDVRSSAVIEEMLVSMKDSYTPVIVTHNIPQAKRIADRIIFLFDGKLIESAATDEFFGDPKEEVTKQFLSGVFG